MTVPVATHEPKHADPVRWAARAWLYSMLARVERARRGQLCRCREQIERELSDTLHNATQQGSLEAPAARMLGRLLLESLSGEERDVFWLYEVERRAITEVAEVVGCSVRSAYARLSKARERMLVAVAAAKHSECVGGPHAHQAAPSRV